MSCVLHVANDSWQINLTYLCTLCAVIVSIVDSCEVVLLRSVPGAIGYDLHRT